MSMNWKGALAAGAVLGAGILAACSDSATAPSARPAMMAKPSFAVGDPTTVAPPNATELRICKAGDVGGTINITDVGNGSGGSGNPTIIADQNGAVAGAQVALSPAAGGAPNCVMAVIDLGNANQQIGDFFTVTETVGAGVNSVKTCYLNNGDAVADACPPDFFINTAHGWTVVFTNTAPPPDVCTYTKGWYQNKNGAPTIVLTIDGRTPNQQRAIFEASPGQPGDVTWGTNNKPNNLLNLYQQLLAAINNLDGNLTAGPTAVDNAISAALAGTGGSNLHISTTLTNEQISALIDTLSSFNQGEFAGFPHCGDEIVN